MKILLIEDDEPTGIALAEALTAHHYTINVATDGRTGLELAEAFDYDLILLDVLMPELDGIHVCRHLRSQGDQTPILLLTAKDTSTDRVIGLDAGADDYVVKPFNLAELLARIRALLRRTTAHRSPIITWENLQLDTCNGIIQYGPLPLKLTPKEYAILELLLLNPRQVFSRTVMIDRLWDITEAPNENTVTTHIKALRQKLQMAGAPKDLIESVYGLGYRFKPIPGIPRDHPSGQPAPTALSAESTASPRGLVPRESTQAEKIPPAPIPSLPKFRTDVSLAPTSGPEATASPDANAKQATADAVMVELWDKFKADFMAQVEGLAAAASLLAEGSLTPEQGQQAKLDVHKLKGSLGIFGYPNGSVLALAIENLLRSPTPLTPAEITQLNQLVASLQQELTHPPGFTHSAIALPDAPNLPLIWVLMADAALATQLQTTAASHHCRVEAFLNSTTVSLGLADSPPRGIVVDLTHFPTREAAWTWLRHLQQLTHPLPRIPLIIVANDLSLVDRVEVGRLGGKACLSHPVTAEALWRSISQIIRPPTRQGRVLAVDDDPAILAMLNPILSPWNLHIHTLNTPQQFWEVLETYEPDLILLDIEMPAFNGIELCQAVRNDPRWGDRPILFLTAHTDEAYIYQAFAAGADDYIRKPIVAPELITRIISRLDRQRLQL